MTTITIELNSEQLKKLQEIKKLWEQSSKEVLIASLDCLYKKIKE